jgi:hypothetical protein
MRDDEQQLIIATELANLSLPNRGLTLARQCAAQQQG